MKRHVFALILSIVLLLVPFAISCVPPAATATAPTDAIAYKSDLIALTNAQTEQTKRIDAIAGKSGVSQADVQTAINSSLASGGYIKKSDMDAAIVAAIAALKADQAWIKDSASTPATTTPAGQIAVKTYSMSQNMIYGAAEYDLFVEVKNGYAETKKILLMGTLTPSIYSTKVKLCTNCDGTNVPNGTQFWTTNTNVQGAEAGKYKGVSTSLSPSDGVNCALIICTTGQIFIGGNQTLLIPIKFKLVYDVAGEAIWTPQWSVTIIP